jgi:hypothetical protein
MSQVAKHYELARHHALAGQSYNADLPDGVRNGINHEMERLEKFAPVDFTDFQEIALVGVESFAQWHEENLSNLSSEQANAWLDLIEETGRTPEGLGVAGHFLYIGQK